MSWQPPARPDWVREINAGRIVPISAEAALPLERDALLAEARARQGLRERGLREFGHPAFPVDEMIEPLDRVLQALETEAELHTVGRWMTRRFLLRLLEVRLQLMTYLREDPGVLDEAVEAPVFIAGAPRTGTTLLHALLAADPAHRAPAGWELLRPVPPPDEADSERAADDPRVALVDRELVLPQTVVSGLLSIHVYGARRPKECLSAMSFAFLSEEFTARYAVPSYESWLTDPADLRPAYRMHRLVLQVLQRRSGRKRWALKSPVHLHSLETLLEVYPDARLIVTHRDPLSMLASLSSLIANLRWAHSDSVDVAAIGRAHANRYQNSFERLITAQQTSAVPTDSIHHLLYADLVQDPIAAVRASYEHLGLRWSDELAKTLQGQRAPQDAAGRHVYTLEAMGLDRDDLNGRFRRYRDSFSVPSES
jgi:hypothetical protein